MSLKSSSSCEPCVIRTTQNIYSQSILLESCTLPNCSHINYYDSVRNERPLLCNNLETVLVGGLAAMQIVLELVYISIKILLLDKMIT